MAAIRKKLVVVGDEGSGKTCMLLKQYTKHFPTEFTPTIFGDFITTIDIDGQKVDLHTWDTPSQDGPGQLWRHRLPYLKGGHVALICFALDSPSSLEHAKTKWALEIKNVLRGRPFLLVGCKNDLREGSQGLVTFEEGTAAAKEIGAGRYLECSAKAGEGVTEVFEHAAREILQAKDVGCGCIVQ